ncbi:nucleotide-binding protein [Sphingomonas edaphi]|uniref:CobQ/CobB/MinD/ParA nucleotide binding domain-containing protein n=1 Tax=Sphingomonas edaphi TaxID=2315689 RepID=A0A418Q1L2_9SPHN|nr:hypothetical protein [Sphingomonas edaphi]RIX31848.1 hypothetical protein D3M59_02295 [Sphingomonas edaphi]
MVETVLFTLILIINNGGGDGKTTWSEILMALARFAGRSVAVLDVDPGLRGFSTRNGPSSADRLEWSGEFDDHRELPDWLNEVKAQDIAVVDTGANLLSAGQEVSGRLQEIAAHVHAQGGRLIIQAVTSPNKAGSGASVKDLYEQFGSTMEFAVIRNQRDGSELFGKEIDQLPVPKVTVPYVPPGLQAYRLRRALPLDQIILNPEPGFAMASALMAAQLGQIAKSAHVRSIVGDGVRETLQPLMKDLQHFEGTSAKTLMAISDTGLLASRGLCSNLASFSKLDPAQLEVFIPAAQALHAALKKSDQLRDPTSN